MSACELRLGNMVWVAKDLLIASQVIANQEVYILRMA